MLRSSPSRRRLALWAGTGALALAGGTLAASLPATAATPADGSIGDTTTSTSWTAGPFAVPNLTGTLGQVTCSAATPCDDFTLSVATSSAFAGSHQLKVDISWANAAADYDLYVLDGAGNVLQTSASSSDPETVLLPATAGTYTVRIVPYTPLGDIVTGTATLVDTAATSGTGGAVQPGSPTYATYAAPESLPGAHSAGEPSIGNSWKSGATLYQSYLDTYRVTFDDSTSPAKASFTDATASLTNGCPQGDTQSLDPILFTDHATGRTFESQLAGKAALTCYTDDDGRTWAPSQGSGINSGVDHQTLGGGAFPAGDLGPLPTSSYQNAVYYCSQDIADASCAVSRDGGTTFGPAVPMYSLLDCGGLHGHVKVAPDGTVYVPNKGCGANQAVVVSEDAGTTWSVRPDPASLAGDSDPSVGIGAKGSVYLGYQNKDGTPRVAVSHDKGKTWLYDQNVGAALGIKNVVFPTVVAGDDDRAAFAFLGTTTAGNYQDAATFTGVWHLYVATTYDGGQTWSTVDATPNDPVQKGSICTGGTTCGQDRNLLDFIDSTVDQQGRVLVAFADGCTGTCASGGAQNFDALATIARQSSGRTLFAVNDPKANLTVSAVSASVSRSGKSTVSSTVRNTGAVAAPETVLQVQDGSALVGTAVVPALAPGQSATLTIKWGTKNLHGAQTLLATADATALVSESDEQDNTRSTTVTLP